jgi:peptide/nickel transport system permease protein
MRVLCITASPASRPGYIVFFPAAFLSVTVLAVNLLGDGLRDALDPRMAKRL